MSGSQTNLTLRQRLRLGKSDKAAAAGMNPETKRKIVRIGLLALLILLVAGGAWAWFSHRGSDARLQEVIDLEAKISKLDNPFSKDGIAMMQQIGSRMKDMPDDLKREARRNGEKLIEAHFHRFYAESSQEQLKDLDNSIAMEQLRNAASSLAGNQSANSNASNNNNNHPGPRGMSDQQRTQWAEKMITNHSPQQRGEFNMWRQGMSARMQQQGIQGGGGFF